MNVKAGTLHQAEHGIALCKEEEKKVEVATRDAMRCTAAFLRRPGVVLDGERRSLPSSSFLPC